MSTRYSMLGFKFPEELFHWPGSPFTRVFKSLTKTFAGVRLRRNVQQALIRLRILNNSGSFSVYGKDNRALCLLDLLKELARAATECGERLNVRRNFKHAKKYSTFKGANDGGQPRRKTPNEVAIHANKNSFVLSSLILSRSLAAFSNSNFFAVSRISVSILAMNASSSSWVLNSGMPSVSALASSA